MTPPLSAMVPPLIDVTDLQLVRSGKLVLDIRQLQLDAGQVLGLIGPNGAGKSTLLRVLAMLEPAQGNYRLGGQAVTLSRDGLRWRRQMGVVFQEPLLLNASVFANVALGLRLRRVPRRQIQSRVSLWLQRLGVAELAGRRAHTLSGGEAQRVALARALVLEPRLLFLDEPFVSLDALTRQPLIQDLRRLILEAGASAVFATHDYLEVLMLADRVAVLDEGRIVQHGAPRYVYRHPATDTVRALLSAARALADVLDEATA